MGGDVPVTWTFQRGGGWIAAPRLEVSFETPLWNDVSLGARAAAGLRGAGDALLGRLRGGFRAEGPPSFVQVQEDAVLDDEVHASVIPPTRSAHGPERA